MFNVLRITKASDSTGSFTEIFRSSRQQDLISRLSRRSSTANTWLVIRLLFKFFHWITIQWEGFAWFYNKAERLEVGFSVSGSRVEFAPNWRVQILRAKMDGWVVKNTFKLFSVLKHKKSVYISNKQDCQKKSDWNLGFLNPKWESFILSKRSHYKLKEVEVQSGTYSFESIRFDLTEFSKESKKKLFPLHTNSTNHCTLVKGVTIN